MNKNFTSFFKSLFKYNNLLKIILLFSIGLFFRFFSNYLLDGGDFLIEILALLTTFTLGESFLLPANLLNNHQKIIENNLELLKSRPRDWIINNDYEFKDRCRRKAHWYFLGQFEGTSYEEFKNQWDNNTKLISKISSRYEEKKQKIILFKQTLYWFINRRKGE